MTDIKPYIYSLAYELAKTRINIDWEFASQNNFKFVPKRHACIIFDKYDIVSTGFNFGTHAEINSILNLKNKNKNKKYNILIIRLTLRSSIKDIKFTISKPCDVCIMKMKGLVKNVYYSESDGTIVKKKFKILNQEPKHISNFNRQKLK